MDTILTKRKAVELYGGKQIYLAKALGVGKSTVSQWAWDEPIPDKHALRIRFVLRPECFRQTA